MVKNLKVVEMPWVVTCGDEGVQINVGRRLGVVGAGVGLEGVEKVFAALKKVLKSDLKIAASAENDWVKQTLRLDDFEQADATIQQQAQVLADANKLGYAGFLPFADPRQLKEGIKGHMVRPKKVHVANKICFTLAGGEQTYNLGCYLISAEWLYLLDKKMAKAIIQTQVEFYTKLSKQKNLEYVFEKEGKLGGSFAVKNERILKSLLV